METQKSEILRLITQYLNSLNYKKTTQTLAEESQEQLENPKIQLFKNAILQGNYQESLQYIDQFVTEPKHKQIISVLIHKQWALEIIYQGNKHEALLHIRKYLSPIINDPSELRKITELLITKTIEEFKILAHWSSTEDLRKALFYEIEAYVDQRLYIKEGRLLQLLDQAQLYQLTQCHFHNSSMKGHSLLYDHYCSESKIPNVLIATISEHGDEVHELAISPSGKYMATADKQKCLIIWQINIESQGICVTMINRLFPHNDVINSICFSQDETTILTSSSDKSYVIIDVKGSIRCQRTIHKDEVNGALYIQEDNFIASGGLDKDLIICKADTGVERNRIHVEKIKSMKYCKMADYIALLFINNTISIFDALSLNTLFKIVEKDNLISFDISQKGYYIITNTSFKFPKINLWDVEGNKILKSFAGHTQERFIIRCAFGGKDELFVSSGSEDSSVMIWNINDGNIVKVLEGHTGSVNSVLWHPVDNNLVISIGDDCTIRMWYTDKINVDIKCPLTDRMYEDSDEDMIPPD